VPNPDGTRTRNEIRSALIKRWMEKWESGMDKHDALTEASLEMRNEIQTEGAVKMAEVLRALGIKEH